MKTKIQIESNNEKLLDIGNDNEKEFIIRIEVSQIGTHAFYFTKDRLEFLIKEMQKINTHIVE